MTLASLAFVFPGQGAQSPGFLHRLPEHEIVRATLDEASAVLDCDVLTLDSAEALQSTVAVQIGLVVAGVVQARALAQAGLTPQFSAGLSVGAYPAAVCCGALAFDDALRMVRKRAELMESAWPSGYGLTAVSGLSETQIETLAATYAQDSGNRVYVANVNAPRQIVVAGSDAALDAFAARARGWSAQGSTAGGAGSFALRTIGRCRRSTRGVVARYCVPHARGRLYRQSRRTTAL